MGMLDKFLDIMKLNDDEFDDDEFFDDDDDVMEEEVKPKKSFFGKKKSVDFEDEDDFELPAKTKPAKPAAAPSKVTPMRTPTRRAASFNMEVCVIKPSSVDDAREITETLLGGRTVILNLEGIDLEVAQRIIDFTCGATYAIGGNLQKISSYIFLVTPNGVEISGDLQDLLNTSFESSMRNRF